MTRTENFLARAGLSDAETDRRVRAAFDTVFFDQSERFWHEKDPGVETSPPRPLP